MTTTHDVARTTLAPARPLRSVLGVALGAGLALGAVDLLLQVTLPYPLANLANSSAVWALAAFVLAVWARTTPARAALAGVVMLVVAVQGYYLVAVAVGMADLTTAVSPAALFWTASGVLAGSVFGVAGTWARDERPWRAAAGLAAASAVLLAEAGVRLLPGSSSGLADVGTVLLGAGAAVAVLLTACERPAHLARAAVLVPPLALLGVVAFKVTGF